MPPNDLQVLMQGRLQISRQLGEGGMGLVYEAIDVETGAKVAVKKLKWSGGPAGLQHFKDEFRSLQSLEHPNLIHLGVLFEEDGNWFFTMELVEGQNFIDYVRPFEDQGPEAQVSAYAHTVPRLIQTPSSVPRIERKTVLDEKRLRQALVQLAQALDFLHQAGKVHLDIKPSNVLVTADRRVVLLDFGIAKEIDCEDETGSQNTAIFGTVEYMAPEQARGDAVGPEADWYAFGVVLYEALTRQIPFSTNPIDVLIKKQSLAPPRPRELDPSVPSDLDALCMELLQIEPALRPSGKGVLRRLSALPVEERMNTISPISRSGTSFFVGRQRELSELMAAFQRTKERNAARVMIIEGESGVGKSALVQAFTKKMREADPLTVVLSGRCYELETVPYKAVDGIVDALSRYLMRLSPKAVSALLPRRVSILGEAFPVLQRVKAIREAPRLEADGLIDPQTQRSRLFGAVRELLLRLTDRNTVVIAIDDLQWADADGMALIAEVLRPPDAPPVFVLATMRSGTTSLGLEPTDLGRSFQGEVQRLALVRLPPEDARELTARLLESGTAGSQDCASKIVAEADGHPLFIQELVHYAATHGAQKALSPRLDEALVSRIAALPALALRILELVSLAGTPLRMDAIARAAHATGADFAKYVTQLRASNFVQTTGLRGTDVVSAYHDRVRETVVAQLGDDARKEGHRELAVALESLGFNDTELLAAHWSEAGDHDHAWEYSVTAAKRARDRCAFGRAAELYLTALQMQPTRHRALVLVKLAEALSFAGQGVLAGENYLAAVHENFRAIEPNSGESPIPSALSDAQGLAASRLELRRRAAAQFMRGCDIARGMTELRAVLAQVGMGIPRTPWLALLSLVLRRAWVWSRGLRFVERDASKVDEALLFRIDLCRDIAAVLASFDNIRGADLSTRTLLLALRAGEPMRLGWALSVEAFLVAVGGVKTKPRVDKLFAIANKLIHRVEDPVSRVYFISTQGYAAYYCGNLLAAEKCLEEGVSLAKDLRLGALWELATTRMFLRWTQTYLGRYALLAAAVPQDVQDARSRGDRYSETAAAMGVQNIAWLILDDPATATQHVDSSIRRIPKESFLVQHWYEFVARTQIDLYEQRGEDALAWVEQRWAALKRSLLPQIQVVAMEALDLRARSALTVAEKHVDGARRLALVAMVLGDARRMLGMGSQVASALAMRLLGAAAHLNGEARGAADHIRKAVRLFDQLGLEGFAASARLALGTVAPSQESATECARGNAWLAEQEVRRPHKLAAMLCPGFGIDKR